MADTSKQASNYHANLHTASMNRVDGSNMIRPTLLDRCPFRRCLSRSRLTEPPKSGARFALSSSSLPRLCVWPILDHLKHRVGVSLQVHWFLNVFARSLL